MSEKQSKPEYDVQTLEFGDDGVVRAYWWTPELQIILDAMGDPEPKLETMSHYCG